MPGFYQDIAVDPHLQERKKKADAIASTKMGPAGRRCTAIRASIRS